jgi:nucleotide-binding universal stress UspA family protein
MITSILVAIDGSDHADHALTYAVEIASKWSAQLIILSVIPPTPIIPDPAGNYPIYLPILSKIPPTPSISDPDSSNPIYLPEFESEIKKSYKDILVNARNIIAKEQPDIEVKTRLEEGRPSDVIVKVARVEDVDLIVLGSRGLGGITGTILGSTSQAVVHSCTKPILIVK